MKFRFDLKEQDKSTKIWESYFYHNSVLIIIT